MTKAKSKTTVRPRATKAKGALTRSKPAPASKPKPSTLDRSAASEFEDHHTQLENLSRALRILAWDLDEQQDEGFYADAFTGIAQSIDDTLVKIGECATRLSRPAGQPS